MTSIFYLIFSSFSRASIIANSRGNWGIEEYFILFSASRKSFKMRLNSASSKPATCA